MDHLAIPVSDQERSRRFYETYFGFGARPARRYDDGVLMLYDAKGFALALGLAEERIAPPTWMHFGVGMRDREAVRALPRRGRRRAGRRVGRAGLRERQVPRPGRLHRRGGMGA